MKRLICWARGHRWTWTDPDGLVKRGHCTRCAKPTTLDLRHLEH